MLRYIQTNTTKSDLSDFTTCVINVRKSTMEKIGFSCFQSQRVSLDAHLVLNIISNDKDEQV